MPTGVPLVVVDRSAMLLSAWLCICLQELLLPSVLLQGICCGTVPKKSFLLAPLQRHLL